MSSYRHALVVINAQEPMLCFSYVFLKLSLFRVAQQKDFGSNRINLFLCDYNIYYRMISPHTNFQLHKWKTTEFSTVVWIVLLVLTKKLPSAWRTFQAVQTFRQHFFNKHVYCMCFCFTYAELPIFVSWLGFVCNWICCL